MSTTDKKISVSLGFTRNMGNFESLRVDIGFDDFARSDESKDEAFDRVYKTVEEEVLKRVEEATRELVALDDKLRREFINRGK